MFFRPQRISIIYDKSFLFSFSYQIWLDLVFYFLHISRSADLLASFISNSLAQYLYITERNHNSFRYWLILNRSRYLFILETWIMTLLSFNIFKPFSIRSIWLLKSDPTVYEFRLCSSDKWFNSSHLVADLVSWKLTPITSNTSQTLDTVSVMMHPRPHPAPRLTIS